MKSILKQSLKLFTMCMAVAVIVTLGQNPTQAQELTVDGSTAGSTFTPGGDSLGGLSFRGTDFGGTTNGGILDINNMGTLTINPSTVGEAVGTFTLEVAFRLPDGVSGNPLQFNGDVIGLYTDADNFALINFNNNPQIAFFNGANGSGAFSIQLHDVCLSNGEPCSIFSDGGIGRNLRRHKVLNTFAFNSFQSGAGNVQFLKAKGSSSMLAPKQTFTITATIRIFPACATCAPFVPAPLVGPPVSKDQCKNGGWKTFNNPSFRNQGDCVSFVNHQ